MRVLFSTEAGSVIARVTITRRKVDLYSPALPARRLPFVNRRNFPLRASRRAAQENSQR